METDEIPQAPFCQLIDDLRQIDLELNRAEHSWIVFAESAKNFVETPQQKFVGLINSRDLGGTFNHLQELLLHDCVATLCRIFDSHRADRITLISVTNLARDCFGESQPEMIAEITEKRGIMLKNDALSTLRKFRNHHIGHNLRGTPKLADYGPIPELIKELSDIIGQLFSLSGSPRWIGQATGSGNMKRAKKFWEYLELGLAVSEDQ